jgi:hypothetical protein
MADPQDDYENEAMMNIINAGSQYGPNLNEADPQDFDDGSQYLINSEGEQENHVQGNASEEYLLIILHFLYI